MDKKISKFDSFIS